jgi:hypothetical protein
MNVVLYQDHHHLPFYGPGHHPDAPLTPEYGERELQHEGKPFPLKSTWLWPVLEGLQESNLPYLAHVSALCGCGKNGRWHFCKRVWVQITTMPEEQVGGIPLIVKNDEKTVTHLWGGDNGTRSPYDFLPEAERDVVHDKTFWKSFFEGKLRDAKAEAELGVRKAAEAERKAREHAALYVVVPA